MKTILQESKRCYLSEAYGPLERHHVMNGPLREFAEENGLWVYITPEWHRKLHGTGDGAQIQKKLKLIAQLTYERERVIQEVGRDPFDKARSDWMQAVRKNYEP